MGSSNPDDFSAEQLKVLLNPKDYRLRLRSGVSVKSVSGNKVSNRARSLSLAKRQIIGNAHPADASHNETEDILERADKLYDLNGFAGHERDKQRDRAFKNILNWMMRTHDPEAAGFDAIWFDLEEDVAEWAEPLICSVLSVETLEQTNQQNASKMDIAKSPIINWRYVYAP